MIRIVIVANIRLYREGLVHVINRGEGLSVVGTAMDRREAVEAAGALTPDVVILEMANGETQATVSDLKRLIPPPRIVGIGVAEHERDILACAEMGVDGYVTRDGLVEQLILAVQDAARGELHCSAQFAATLMRRLATVSATVDSPRTAECLTCREREIVGLLERELTNKQIAVSLGIEVATVKNHVHNLLEKLGVHRRAEAVRASQAVALRRS